VISPNRLNKLLVSTISPMASSPVRVTLPKDSVQIHKHRQLRVRTLGNPNDDGEVMSVGIDLKTEDRNLFESRTGASRRKGLFKDGKARCAVAVSEWSRLCRTSEV
jgi:hypothetical protein